MAYLSRTARAGRGPFHPILLRLPVMFFVAALVCDVLMAVDGQFVWFRIAQYLLGAGILTCGLAAFAGLLDYLGHPDLRTLALGWTLFLGNALAIVIETFNLYRRHFAGPVAVTPGFFALSVFAVVVLLITSRLGFDLAMRRRIMP